MLALPALLLFGAARAQEPQLYPKDYWSAHPELVEQLATPERIADAVAASTQFERDAILAATYLRLLEAFVDMKGGSRPINSPDSETDAEERVRSGYDGALDAVRARYRGNDRFDDVYRAVARQRDRAIYQRWLPEYIGWNRIHGSEALADEPLSLGLVPGAAFIEPASVYLIATAAGGVLLLGFAFPLLGWFRREELDQRPSDGFRSDGPMDAADAIEEQANRMLALFGAAPLRDVRKGTAAIPMRFERQVTLTHRVEERQIRFAQATPPIHRGVEGERREFAALEEAIAARGSNALFSGESYVLSDLQLSAVRHERCSPCSGAGDRSCGSCGGRGRIEPPCARCGGSGWTMHYSHARHQKDWHTQSQRHTCGSCGGSGRGWPTSCAGCGGSGRVTCSACSGRGTVAILRTETPVGESGEIRRSVTMPADAGFLGDETQLDEAIDSFWPDLVERQLKPGARVSHQPAGSNGYAVSGSGEAVLSGARGTAESMVAQGYDLGSVRQHYSTSFLDPYVAPAVESGLNDRLKVEVAHAVEQDGKPDEVSLGERFHGALGADAAMRLIAFLRDSMRAMSRAQAWRIWRWALLWSPLMLVGAVVLLLVPGSATPALILFGAGAAGYVVGFGVSGHLTTRAIYLSSDEHGAADPRPYARQVNRLAFTVTLIWSLGAAYLAIAYLPILPDRGEASARMFAGANPRRPAMTAGSAAGIEEAASIAEAPDEAGATEGATPSFSCSGRLSDVERMICGNRELAELDRLMAHRYEAARAARGSQARRELLERQLELLRARNRCGDVDCLLAWYRSHPLIEGA